MTATIGVRSILIDKNTVAKAYSLKRYSFVSVLPDIFSTVLNARKGFESSAKKCRIMYSNPPDFYFKWRKVQATTTK
jgi:hypothetical protein